jgi:hypothetical protein
MAQVNTGGSLSASERLERLAQEAIVVTKKAKRHKKSLGGDNFYANKLATLRADATNAFRDLAPTSAGDSSAIAELLETVFSPTANARGRAAASQELCYNLRTTWRSTAAPKENEGLFPLSLLAQAKRGYLVSAGRQMNGAHGMNWYAAAVMMRRLVEISIIEAFEAKGVQGKIKDVAGNYLQLSDLISKALAEASLPLSRNAKKALPGLRDLGHMSAHGRYFTAQKGDVDAMQAGCRIVVEEFLHYAALLGITDRPTTGIS